MVDPEVNDIVYILNVGDNHFGDPVPLYRDAIIKMIYYNQYVENCPKKYLCALIDAPDSKFLLKRKQFLFLNQTIE